MQFVQRDDKTLIYYNCEHLNFLALELLQEKFPHVMISMHSHETGMVLYVEMQSKNENWLFFVVFLIKVFVVFVVWYFV